MEPVELNSAPTRSTVLLKPVDVPKASDVLARELRERILSGELVGEKEWVVPSELGFRLGGKLLGCVHGGLR